MDCAPYPAFRTSHLSLGQPGAAFRSRRGSAKVPPAPLRGPAPPRPPPPGAPVLPHPHPVPPPLGAPTDLRPPCLHTNPEPPGSQDPAPPSPLRAGPAYCPGPGFRGAGPAGSAWGSSRLPAAHRLWATLANLGPGHRGSAVSWEVPGALGERPPSTISPPLTSPPPQGDAGRGRSNCPRLERGSERWPWARTWSPRLRQLCLGLSSSPIE